jgi:CxxC-x17-CxxC domain-containing protein
VSFEDKTLTCRDCGKSFAFTAGEQSFYAEKGLLNNPSRCPECRQQRKQQQAGGSYSGGASHSRERGPRTSENRIQHPVQCAACGKETTVPFVPKYDRPVYCSDCFEQQRVATTAGSAR